MPTTYRRSSTAISTIALLLAFSLSSAEQAEAGPLSRFGKQARQQRKARATADKTLDRLSSGKLGKPLAKLRRGTRRAQAGWWALKTSPVTTAVLVGGTGVAATEGFDPRARAAGGAVAVVSLGVKQIVEGRAKRKMKRRANADTARKILEDPGYRGTLNGADEKTLRTGYQIGAPARE